MILDAIQHDIKEAMKAKDSFRLSVLRMAQGAFQTKQIEKRAKTGEQGVSLTDDEAMDILRKEVKKRKDAVSEYKKVGRPELAKKEEEEANIIYAYLPAEIDDSLLDAIVMKAIAGIHGATEKDFGKIMGLVIKETKGNASGERVQASVKRHLSHPA